MLEDKLNKIISAFEVLLYYLIWGGFIVYFLAALYFIITLNTNYKGNIDSGPALLESLIAIVIGVVFCVIQTLIVRICGMWLHSWCELIKLNRNTAENTLKIIQSCTNNSSIIQNKDNQANT